MPTIQDVAKLAGVSTATVSKVLSNTPYFTEETRQKVMVAVDELQYRPNLAARALSSGKTSVIAVVFPYIYDTIFKDPHVMSILQGIETVLTSNEYHILLSTPRLTDDGPEENYVRLIRGGFIDGVIAIDNVPLASVAVEPRKMGLPVVVVGYHESEYVVRNDDFAGGKMQLEHVLSLGHKNIALIIVPPKNNYAINARLDGIRAHARAIGLDIDATPTAYSDFSTEGGAKATAEIMRDAPDTTAIIALNDRMAMGAVQQLQTMGYRVPEDVSVVGYDNLDVSGLFTPTLTTIDQDANQLGENAAQLILDVLDDDKTDFAHENITVPSLVQRASSAPVT